MNSMNFPLEEMSSTWLRHNVLQTNAELKKIEDCDFLKANKTI